MGGFSMGGAAVIEAAARACGCFRAHSALRSVVSRPRFQLAGVCTIATQGVGICNKGDGSLKACAEWLSARSVPFMLCVGTRDEVLSPKCSEMVAEWGGAYDRHNGKTQLVHLAGNGHSC